MSHFSTYNSHVLSLDNLINSNKENHSNYLKKVDQTYLLEFPLVDNILIKSDDMTKNSWTSQYLDIELILIVCTVVFPKVPKITTKNN